MATLKFLRPLLSPAKLHKSGVVTDSEAELGSLRQRNSNNAYEPRWEVKFVPDDLENPKNWSLSYRIFATVAFAFTTWATLLFSTCYTSGIPGMMADFDIYNETLMSLGLSIYLVGMGIGSLVLAPLSETFGRRPVYLVSLTVFLAFIPLCATSKSFTQLIICRFLASLVGTVVVATGPGSIVDIMEPSHLRLAISAYCIGPMLGPVAGPIIGGFTFERWGWRALDWLALILSGVGAIAIFLIPETHAPIILRKRATNQRDQTQDRRWWSQYDNKTRPSEVLKKAIFRPFILAFTEPVLWFWNFYISTVYAVLYLCFVAYPFIYVGERNWSVGISGLAFTGVFIGTVLATACEPLFMRIINSQPKDPQTGKLAPEASLTVVCLAAILAPVGQLIFALTSMPISIHWSRGIIAGVPFGFGNTVIFIYGMHYIGGAYGNYASSALAGNAFCRFVLGAVLVLVGNDMYATLTARTAGIILAAIEFALVPIPFVFYRWGGKIRMNSQVVQQMNREI